MLPSKQQWKKLHNLFFPKKFWIFLFVSTLIFNISSELIKYLGDLTIEFFRSSGLWQQNLQDNLFILSERWIFRIHLYIVSCAWTFDVYRIISNQLTCCGLVVWICVSKYICMYVTMMWWYEVTRDVKYI